MYSIIKRLFDIVFALIILFFSLPLTILITILLFIVNSGKPFFIQARPGKDERIFKLIKFKTMNDNKDSNGNLLSDKQRMTSMGNFVRKTSIDEIPQMLNVLKGDMSLIGPRPLLVQYLPLYNETQKKRHLVRPGITGWAQVNGRNAINWQKKFELDVWYVENQCFSLDIKIFFRTIKNILISEGINQAGQVTAEAFKGNN
jgi:undecaprenyl phosphate N,N'-diacetylbacillosamine 1-phosphate transferase